MGDVFAKLDGSGDSSPSDSAPAVPSGSNEWLFEAIRLLNDPAGQLPALSQDQLDHLLRQCLAGGSTESALRCVKLGANTDTRYETGATPLHIAAANGSVVAVRGLIALGADLDALDSEGLAPLEYAATSRPEMAHILLANGCARVFGRASWAHGFGDVSRIQASVASRDMLNLVRALDEDDEPETLDFRVSVSLLACGHEEVQLAQPVVAAWRARHEAASVMLELVGDCRFDRSRSSVGGRSH